MLKNEVSNIKYNIGCPAKIEKYFKDDEWNELKNVSSTFLFKIVILLVGALISAFFYQFIKNDIPIDIIIKTYKNNWYLILILIPIHEYAHAIIYPKFGLSDKTIIGFWPKKFVFYAYHDKPMKRNRILLAMLSPLFMLTIVPVLLISILNLNSVYLAIITLLNPMAGAGDIFYTILVLKQVPKNSLVRTDTSRFFCKKED